MAYMALLKNDGKGMKGRNKGTGLNKEALREGGWETEDGINPQGKAGQKSGSALWHCIGKSIDCRM